jgi:hypothetical protein
LNLLPVRRDHCRSPPAQEIALALFDPVSITRKIEATPFSRAPNVVMAYPHFEDWKHLYKPQPLRMPDARGIYRNVDAFDSRYQDMKRDHVKNVRKHLGMMQEGATGQAVIAELKARSSFTVYIFPFDFLPSGDWSTGTGALTEPLSLPQTAAERARGTKPPATQVCGNGACWADLESRAGKSVDVFFTARRYRESRGDGVLLHELVHATRLMSGVFRYSPVGGGYGNNEEFYANTIEMIYRSEKKLPIYDYHYHPFDSASFLEKNMARVLLTDLRASQQSLFLALAEVDAAFNPIRQLENQRRKLVGG